MVTDLGDNVLTFNTKFTVNDRVRETGDDDEDEEDNEEDEDGDDESDTDSTDSNDSDEDEEAAELLTGKTTSLNTLIQFLNYDDMHE